MNNTSNGVSASPFEAVAAAASGRHPNLTATPSSHSNVSSLASSTELARLDAPPGQPQVDISRHPSGIVPVLQYS